MGNSNSSLTGLDQLIAQSLGIELTNGQYNIVKFEHYSYPQNLVYSLFSGGISDINKLVEVNFMSQNDKEVHIYSFDMSRKQLLLDRIIEFNDVFNSYYAMGQPIQNFEELTEISRQLNKIENIDNANKYDIECSYIPYIYAKYWNRLMENMKNKRYDHKPLETAMNNILIQLNLHMDIATRKRILYINNIEDNLSKEIIDQFKTYYPNKTAKPGSDFMGFETLKSQIIERLEKLNELIHSSNVNLDKNPGSIVGGDLDYNISTTLILIVIILLLFHVCFMFVIRNTPISLFVSILVVWFGYRQLVT